MPAGIAPHRRVTLPPELVELCLLAGTEGTTFRQRQHFLLLLRCLSCAWRHYADLLYEEHADYREASPSTKLYAHRSTTRLALDAFTVYGLVHPPFTPDWSGQQVEEDLNNGTTLAPSAQEISDAAAQVLSHFGSLRELLILESWQIYTNDRATIETSLAHLTRLEMISSSTPDVCGIVTLIPTLRHIHLSDHHSSNRHGHGRFDVWRISPPRCALGSCFVAPAASARSHRDFLTWLLQGSRMSLRVLELPDAASEEVEAASKGLCQLRHLSIPYCPSLKTTMPATATTSTKSIAYYWLYPSMIPNGREGATWTKHLHTLLEASDGTIEALSVIWLPSRFKNPSMIGSLPGVNPVADMWRRDCAEISRICQTRNVKFEGHVVPSTWPRFPSVFEMNGQCQTLAQCVKAIDVLARGRLTRVAGTTLPRRLDRWTSRLLPIS